MSADLLAPIAKGTGGADYAILVTAINDRLRRINTALGGIDSTPAVVPSAVEFGTHAQRVSHPAGSGDALFVETDRGSVIYSSNGSQWEYLSGEWAAPYTSLPTDLGKNDYGFLFFDQTNWRRFEWAAKGAPPASKSPGWQRANGEVPTAFIAMLPYGPGTDMATGWVPCDGKANIQITQDDASMKTITAPEIITDITGNLAGAYVRGCSVAAYQNTANPAVEPTISGNTTRAFAGITQASDGGTGGGPGTVSEPASGHSHGFAVTVNLPGDPIRNIAIPFYLKK